MDYIEVQMADSDSNTTKQYYVAMYNGKVVRTTADAEEFEIILEIAAQLPELDIELIEADYEDSFTDCYSNSYGHHTTDTRDWVESHWTIGGKEMSTSDLFDLLMTRLNWFDEPMTISATPEASPFPLTLPSLKRLTPPGTEFIVTFSDSKSGELKTMNCGHCMTDDREVRSGDSKEVFRVFDLIANEHHSFPVKTIQSVKIRGSIFRLKEAV